MYVRPPQVPVVHAHEAARAARDGLLLPGPALLRLPALGLRLHVHASTASLLRVYSYIDGVQSSSHMQTEDTNDPRYMAPAVVARREQALEYVHKLHTQLLGSSLLTVKLYIYDTYQH